MHKNNAKVAIEAWSRIDSGVPLYEVLAAIDVVLPAGDFMRVINMNTNTIPDFNQDIEYQIHHIHWRHIAEFNENADDPNEIENWEFLSPIGKNWERFKKEISEPCWDRHTKYRRNPLPKPDKYGWIPIESVPLMVDVDLYYLNGFCGGGANHVDAFFTNNTRCCIHVVIGPNKHHRRAYISASIAKSVGATHWRPSTGKPE